MIFVEVHVHECKMVSSFLKAGLWTVVGSE